MTRKPETYRWHKDGMFEHLDGDWVTRSAYYRLKDEYERLERKVKELEQQVARSYDIYVTNKEQT